MIAGWENWQGGFIRVGYPPPCQPPLVTAESPSPQSIPKNAYWFVDLLLQEDLLLNSRVWLFINRSRQIAFASDSKHEAFRLQRWRSVSTSSEEGWRGFRPLSPFPNFCRSSYLVRFLNGFDTEVS